MEGFRGIRILAAMAAGLVGLATAAPVAAQTSRPIYIDSHCSTPLEIRIRRVANISVSVGPYRIPTGNVSRGSSDALQLASGERFTSNPSQPVNIHAVALVPEGGTVDILGTTRGSSRTFVPVTPRFNQDNGRHEIHIECMAALTARGGGGNRTAQTQATPRPDDRFRFTFLCPQTAEEALRKLEQLEFGSGGSTVPPVQGSRSGYRVTVDGFATDWQRRDISIHYDRRNNSLSHFEIVVKAPIATLFPVLQRHYPQARCTSALNCGVGYQSGLPRGRLIGPGLIAYQLTSLVPQETTFSCTYSSGLN